MKQLRTALYIFSVLLTLQMLAACEANHSRVASATNASAVITPEQIQAFQSTLYTFGTTQGCVSCHASRVSPAWMNSDVKIAYSLAVPFVDFNNPTLSEFATYASNNHCNDPICANPSIAASVQSLISEWAATEIIFAGGGAPLTGGSALANPKYVTLAMAIPSPLPAITSATPAVMRFDLGQLTPPVPGLAGAILEISINSYNSANNEYKVYNPRVVGTSVPVTFTGLHVYVRAAVGAGLGMEDSNQGIYWSNVNATTMPFAIPSPLPVGPITGAKSLTSVSLGIQAQSAADVLTIGFAQIQ